MMNKIILLSLIDFSLNSFAQKSFFGVDAGINVANQKFIDNTATFPYSLNTQNIVEPSFGAFYQLGINNKLAARGGAQYMSHGRNYKPSVYSTSTFNIRINYLSLPISIHYFANENLSLDAGVYVNFKLNDNATGYHKNDYGFILGAEHVVFRNFSLGINYFFGAKNIWLDDQGEKIKCFNRALQFTLIYKFKKKS